jgi:2-methylisocitrate lyase-like PEP mutase family enzyme
MRTRELREALDEDFAVIPDCYDGLSARLLESLGFRVLYLPDSAVGSWIGLRDTEPLAASELISIVGGAVETPLIVEAQLGVVDAASSVAEVAHRLNILLTVLSEAGAAAIAVRVAPSSAIRSAASPELDMNLLTDVLPLISVRRRESLMIRLSRAWTVEGRSTVTEALDLARELGCFVGRDLAESPWPEEATERSVCAFVSDVTSETAIHVERAGYGACIADGTVLRAALGAVDEVLGLYATHGAIDPISDRECDWLDVQELLRRDVYEQVEHEFGA